MFSPVLPIFLLTVFHTSSENIFSKNTTIAHPESGLFLSHIGPYTPSEMIIHNSAIFPMTNNMCHFLPLSAAEKIPNCNVTVQRTKRLIPVIIGLGLGAITLGMSASSAIQVSSLQKEIALVGRSLAELSDTTKIYGAQLVTIQSDQIQLTEQLQMTQRLLDSITPIVDNHSDTINALQNRISFLQIQFQHSFLYQALSQILRNELTLAFLAPSDLHTVVFSIIRQGNLTFNPSLGSLPLAHIITRLLIRQQIDFIPSILYSTPNLSEIGRLVITSFFAVPRSDAPLFLLYKLIIIPFFHENETLQLSQLPRYFAIQPSNNITIEWYDHDDLGCDFRLMTTCRNTPPFRFMSDASCLGQILNGLPLSRCHMAPVPSSPFFLRQLHDNLWITSSLQSLHCVIVRNYDLQSLAHQASSPNEQLILPPVALVNVTPGHTIVCPGFSLTGSALNQNAPSVIILYNNTSFLNNVSVLNVYRHLTRNNSWSTPKLLEHEVKQMIQFAEKRSSMPTFSLPHPMYLSVISVLLLGCILTCAAITTICYIRRCYSTRLLQDLRVALPPLSIARNII